jgi:hypothetical protein
MMYLISIVVYFSRVKMGEIGNKCHRSLTKGTITIKKGVKRMEAGWGTLVGVQILQRV